MHPAEVRTGVSKIRLIASSIEDDSMTSKNEKSLTKRLTTNSRAKKIRAAIKLTNSKHHNIFKS